MAAEVDAASFGNSFGGVARVWKDLAHFEEPIMAALKSAHFSQAASMTNDIDPEETREWLEALAAVIETEGVERAHFLIESLVDQARRAGANLPYKADTAYINTIPPHL